MSSSTKLNEADMNFWMCEAGRDDQWVTMSQLYDHEKEEEEWLYEVHLSDDHRNADRERQWGKFSSQKQCGQLANKYRANDQFRGTKLYFAR